MSTTPLTCGGSRKLLPCIGKRSPVAEHRRASAGWYCGTRSTTKRLHASAIQSCCARGSAKRPVLRSNGSRKFCAAAMASCCQRLGHSGVLSMRKPAGQRACRRKCASSFRFNAGGQLRAKDKPAQCRFQRATCSRSPSFDVSCGVQAIPARRCWERGHSARCGQHVAGHLSRANEEHKVDESQT